MNEAEGGTSEGDWGLSLPPTTATVTVPFMGELVVWRLPINLQLFLALLLFSIFLVGYLLCRFYMDWTFLLVSLVIDKL